ncbi:LOW QUALITY PROTEIN: hypothetical protein Cgig2_002908 [Carnegiea gigantea]|uniref:Uncharacterized protein n=1 Tax=Carnegiea gigantea TaxID=171969 RepID=A0A9Q1GQS3_9CARY|nr:LOW QUALITY PROTEIN: hypothetical protein Cgig2_002908 [Carnegiea gigantea]
MSENLAAGSALIKLPLGAHRRAADGLTSNLHGLQGVVCSWGPGVQPPADRLSECRGVDWSAPTSPTWVGADTAISSVRPSSIPSWLAGSEGVVSPLLDDPRPRLPPAQEWYPQSQRPSTLPWLALHKIKGKSGQNQMKRLTNTGVADVLRKILKDQKARCGKEEVVPKNFNLASQFKGSLSLDLLFLLSGPFTDSIA